MLVRDEEGLKTAIQQHYGGRLSLNPVGEEEGAAGENGEEEDEL